VLDVGNAFRVSEDTFDEMHDVAVTPLQGSRDAFVHKDFSGLGFAKIVLPNHLDHSYVSPVCSLPSPFHEC